MPTETQEGLGVMLRDLTHLVAGRSLIRDLHANADARALTAVVGPSGSGKSTLLRVVGGLERPTRGLVQVGDLTVNALGAGAQRKYLREQVGFVFQDAGLVEHWSARKNISIALKALPSSPASDQLGIEDAADAVGIDGVLDAPAYSLSGGERIRVAFARLLVRKPALVLADEPTAALDAENANEIHVLLRSLADAGSTVLTATHDRDLIERCDATIGL